MTLAPLHKTIVVGVNEKGYRIGSDHHNHNPRISDVVVDALRDLHEDYQIGYSTLSKIFNLNKHTIFMLFILIIKFYDLILHPEKLLCL